MKEAWCLATTLSDAKAADIVKLYGRRFTIEETFRDQKNLRFGLGLSATHIGSTDRRDRLLLLAAIAQALLTLLGAAGEAFHAALEVTLCSGGWIEAAAVRAEYTADDRAHLEDLIDLGIDVIDATPQSGDFLLDLARIQKLDAHSVLRPLLAKLPGTLEIFFVLAEEVAALVEADRKAKLLSKVLEPLDRVPGQLHVDRSGPDVPEAAGRESGRSL